MRLRPLGAMASLAALASAALLAGSGNGEAPSPADRCAAEDGAVAIPAGEVLLGEDGEGRPGRVTTVPAFAIDRHEVTNRQFARFVAQTGYRTQAEREGASAVFVQPTEQVSLDDASRWWRFVKGADWRHPQGPASGIDGRGNDPVVHVTRADAQAYATWAGGYLPNEAQWERAARAAQNGSVSPASWAFDDRDKARANVWEGPFPVADAGRDGFKGIAPVGCFGANGYGVFDMVGNVWEWTSAQSGGASDAMGVVKGGSYLCAMNYCANFRPAGFQAQELDLGTSHIGFRVAYGPD